MTQHNTVGKATLNRLIPKSVSNRMILAANDAIADLTQEETTEQTPYSKLKGFLISLKHERIERELPSYVFDMGGFNE